MGESLAPFIDHTLLAADATAADVERLCAEAREHGFAAVCVNGLHVARVARALAGSGVAACSVAAFPLGAMEPRAKRFEAECALDAGAREIDAVIALGALLEGDDVLVARDLAGLAEACHARGALLKVILECARLDDATKRRAARLALEAGADFLKTSTGTAGGASEADVRLLVELAGDRARVKASGGIRDAAAARAMLAAGAARLGTSAGLAILRGAQG
jgi:deoxyribose-phosphate aldolase